MSVFSLSIKDYIIEKNDLQSELLDISMDLRLIHNHLSGDIDAIEAKCNVEAELLKKKYCPDAAYAQNGFDPNSIASDEYEAYLRELDELLDEKDKIVERREKEANDKELAKKQQQTVAETRLQEVNAQLESYKEGRNQDIQEDFGYFQ